MEPHIPDLEIFVALKWILLLMLTSGLMTFAGLVVKRWWYGSEKNNRRDDPGESRGWINRFLDMQQQSTKAAIDLKQEMSQIRTALEDNTDAIRELSRVSKCEYKERHTR